jgi:hypothetical protein
VQVSDAAEVYFDEVNPIREQHEYAVHEALQRERDAWHALERASRPDEDLSLLEARRERWQAASHALVGALRALKR